mmetsp:Transcript_93491/g.270104  ORF Transcript_93491/g.270104 Transcript_93491/m.270104 type:complete len:209 (-) Transcript_93491:1336-1962(-)
MRHGARANHLRFGRLHVHSKRWLLGATLDRGVLLRHLHRELHTARLVRQGGQERCAGKRSEHRGRQVFGLGHVADAHLYIPQCAVPDFAHRRHRQGVRYGDPFRSDALHCVLGPRREVLRDQHDLRAHGRREPRERRGRGALVDDAGGKDQQVLRLCRLPPRAGPRRVQRCLRRRRHGRLRLQLRVRGALRHLRHGERRQLPPLRSHL